MKKRLRLARHLEALQRLEAACFAPPVSQESPLIRCEEMLRRIDAFCWGEERMMHVGDEKGAVLDAAVRSVTGHNCLELGTYCGYSALRIGRLLPEAGRLVSVDRRVQPLARRLLAQCQMEKKVELKEGEVTEVLKHLTTPFDLVFMDHGKQQYISDLQLLETLNLIPTAVIVIDNVHAALEAYLTQHYPQTKFHRLHKSYSSDEPDVISVTRKT
jgi:catechol O-methyltransferase